MTPRFSSTVFVLLLLVSCAKRTGFDRGQMETALKLDAPTFVTSGLTVEQIEKLQPQVKLPITVAVAPPLVSKSGWRGDELRSWTPDEVNEIESWVPPLQRAGVIRDLVLLPSVLVEQCRYDDPGCVLRANRSAAARVQADTLLIISLVTATEEYSNPSALLDVTIVGMWLAPGHHRDALTIAEGALIDNRNEYLYAFARGEAEERMIRPLMYADVKNAEHISRLGAVRSFGREFIQHTSRLTTR